MRPLLCLITMGIRAGVEPLELWEAVRQGATGRQRTLDRLGRFLSSKHDPADFTLRLLVSDYESEWLCPEYATLLMRS